MAEFPALPLWTDAYLADTTHLSDAEHGIYLLLIMHLWRTPERRFPNDPAWIARKMGRSVEAFENTVIPIMREFMRCDGNWWTQKRVLLEWEYLSKKSHQRSVAAKARWKKEKGPCGEDAGPHRSRNAPTPTPTPTPLKGSSLRSEPRARTPSDFQSFWDEYPHKVGKAAALKSWASAVKVASLDEIIAGVRRYVAAKPDDREWCNPTTFLNQHRWQDEPATVNGSNGHARPGPGTTLFIAAANVLAKRQQQRENDFGADHDPPVALLDRRRAPGDA